MVLLPHPLHVDLLAVELRAVQVGDAAHHLRAGRHGDQPVALGPGAAGVGDHLSAEHLWVINRFETDPVSPSLGGGGPARRYWLKATDTASSRLKVYMVCKDPGLKVDIFYVQTPPSARVGVQVYELAQWRVNS